LASSALDYLVKQRWGSGSGGGLLAAITLDGVPENLALGVALIGAGPGAAAALAGSIPPSNLPEAAGGAASMVEDGRSTRSVIALWSAAAVLLSQLG
jgi:ZIP family zinc transporter